MFVDRRSPYSQRKGEAGGSVHELSDEVHQVCCIFFVVVVVIFKSPASTSLIMIRACIYLEASKHAAAARNTRRRNLRLLRPCLIEKLRMIFAILERSIVKNNKSFIVELLHFLLRSS